MASARFALVVRRPPPHADLSVDVSASETVAQLAERVSALAAGALRLCFRGALLSRGDETLGALGITPRHFVVACFDGGPVLSWVDATGGSAPLGAVHAGAEADGTTLLLARAAIEGGVHPGKVAAPLGSCRAGYGGKEVCAGAYQVLVAVDRCGRPWPRYHPLQDADGRAGCSVLASRPASGGALPKGALPAGWESDGTRLFAAHAADGAGGRCPGKTRPGFDGCNVGYGGSERTLHPCRVLCLPEGFVPPAEGAAPPEPAIKLRRHLNSVAELLVWHPGAEGLEPPPAAGSSPQKVTPNAPPARPRAMHCHDMMGGYCKAADEEYLQGFAGWDAIDSFVYFAHHRVSMPPQCWIDACHARGVPCLGTLITEGPAGVGENSTLLGQGDATAERLVDLAEAYGFDGWLINIEAPIDGLGGVYALAEWLQLLTLLTKQRIGDHSLTIVYDSLSVDGAIGYQNALTHHNKPLFDACDGIFTNYWWSAPHLAASAALAAERTFDVYVGVDCFARGVSYSAGPGCASAVSAVRGAGLSIAIFAPGWCFECGEAKGRSGEEARQCDARFWDALDVRRLFTRRGM